jgi:putative flippase GtrA
VRDPAHRFPRGPRAKVWGWDSTRGGEQGRGKNRIPGRLETRRDFAAEVRWDTIAHPSLRYGPWVRGSLKHTSAKYAQFSAVGFSNMLVDVGVLNLLLLLAPTNSPGVLVLYNVVALVLANVNSYVWNTLWTFREQAEHDAKQVGLFTAQGLLNVAVGSALLWLAAHGLNAYTDLSPWLSGNAAKAISTVTASTMSFLFLRLFVFRRREARV